jgi:hypothetical protein
LRNDLSEKPSFRAVKNLIAILSDKGHDFKPHALNYTLSGSLDNVRQILFQKHNGDFCLKVWMEVPSWNMTIKIDLYPGLLSIFVVRITKNAYLHTVSYMVVPLQTRKISTNIIREMSLIGFFRNKT